LPERAFWKSALCAWQIVAHQFPMHLPAIFVFSPNLTYFCGGNSELMRHTGVYCFSWRTGGCWLSCLQRRERDSSL